MTLKLRDYQTEGVQALYSYFAQHTGNPLVAMPTGTGKSVVIAGFLQSVYLHFPTERVMVLTHVKELIEQNHRKLLEAWPMAPAGIYSAGIGRRDTMHKIIFAGIASVAKRASEFGHVGLLLIDEAHLVSPSDETMYQGFIAALKVVNPYLKVIGFTATAWRLGHGKLHEQHPIFTDVCYDITSRQAFNRLIDEGYLCTLVPKKTEAKLDTDGVHVRGGEFAISELQAAVDKYEVTLAALREAVQLANDRWSWLLFCSGVEHSEHVATMLTELGIECKAVHSKMKPAERDKIIADWKAGRLRAVANNNVMTTGIDHPALSCIVVLRPTMSTVLWVQMLGRGTRPFYAPGHNLDTVQGRLDAIAASHKQNCLVLDFAGNTRRLGPINDPVIPKRKGEKVGEAPIKLCPNCATYNHASARHCIFCGSEFPSYGPKVYNTAGTEELIKIDLPETHVFKVDHVTYSAHHKVGKPPSLRATYYCGIRAFSEYLGFEHPDAFSQRRARRWWSERLNAELRGPDELLRAPDTTDEALRRSAQLRAPTHLRVWVNKQYPQIIAQCFDGSAFGEQAVGSVPEPSADVDGAASARSVAHAAETVSKGGKTPIDKKSFDDFDDDIPF